MRRILLRPFRLGLINRFLKNRRSRTRTIGLVIFGLIITTVIYYTSYRVIGYFHRQNELGIILSLKIFEMAWMIIFALLIFSSMVAGISTIFMSRDNEILFAAPIKPDRLYFMRFITTSIYTSWMVIVFSVPVFGAYGVVFKAGWTYWPLMIFVLLAMAAVACGVALAATIILVNIFPVRRTRDIVVYLSLLGGILLYLFIRLLRPEELADPDRFPDFIEYLSALSAPAAPLFPAGWSARLLGDFLQYREVDWLLLCLFGLTPLVIFFFGEILMKKMFFKGFSKAQESFGGQRSFKPRPYRRAGPGWFFRKEARVFMRDSTEWSQLFMIGALILVYLYNFKVLPLDRAPIATVHLANLIGYANIALAGFLVVSLCARFVYPSVSMEKEAFYVLRTSPMSIGRYLFYKYLFYLIPFTLIMLTLLLAGNHLLKIDGPIWWISLVTGLMITWSTLGTALGFGARYADFKLENRASAMGGVGAITYLFTAMGLTLLIIAMGSFPAYRLVRGWMTGFGLTVGDQWMMSLAVLSMVGVAVAVPWVSIKRGLKRLRA